MEEPDAVSFSMMIDTPQNAHVALDEGVAARSPSQWVDDDSSDTCFRCKTALGYTLLGSNRSHCRCCGRLFCSRCCSQFAVIPPFISVPKPSRKHAREDLTKPVRLCRPCYERIENLQALATQQVPVDKVDLDVFALQRRAATENGDSFARQFANFKLSSFREIQYALPDHQFSEEQRAMLWANRRHFVGHNKWMVQLLRSIDYTTASTEVLDEVNALLASMTDHQQAKPPVACWDLMCTRTCSAELDIECAIQLLNQRVRCNRIRERALAVLDRCAEDEMRCFVPYLVRHSLYSPIMYKWLIDKCTRSPLIASEVYWEFQTYLMHDPRDYNDLLNRPTSASFDVIHEALTDWKRAVPEGVRAKVQSTQILVNAIRRSYWPAQGRRTPDMGEQVWSELAKFEHGLGFCMPAALESELQLHDAHALASATCPVVIGFRRREGGRLAAICDEVDITYRDPLLAGHGADGPPDLSYLWKPEDVRKDQIILSVVRMVGIVVEREEGIQLPLVTYNVRPTSAGDGFIEMVPGCATLQHIVRERRMDLLTWMIDQNENSTEPAGVLRDRFVKSCAAYSVITYLLGIGDRHLENIMLRTDGAFFHIDYGFVLGQDPKPLKKPPIRITEEMLTVLGGMQSDTYQRFKQLCSIIYNCVRRHINLFVCMLRMFIEANPPIGGRPFDEALLMDEVRRRFVPGETHAEAEIQLCTHLDRGSGYSRAYALIDYFHSRRSRSAMMNLPTKVATGTLNTVHTLVTALWQVTGLTENSTPK